MTEEPPVISAEGQTGGGGGGEGGPGGGDGGRGPGGYGEGGLGGGGTMATHWNIGTHHTLRLATVHVAL